MRGGAGVSCEYGEDFRKLSLNDRVLRTVLFGGFQHGIKGAGIDTRRGGSEAFGILIKALTGVRRAGEVLAVIGKRWRSA